MDNLSRPRGTQRENPECEAAAGCSKLHQRVWVRHIVPERKNGDPQTKRAKSDHTV